MKRYFDLLKQAFTEFQQDKAQRLGAALAYYMIFSIAPLLLIAIAIAGIAFGKSQAQEQIVDQLRRLMGDAGAKAIAEMLANAAKPKTGTLAIVIGSVTLLIGAASVFGNLKDALNTIWNVEVKPSGGIMSMIKQRFLSFAMVLGVGFLLLVTLVFDAAIASMGKYADNRLPGGEALWQSLQLVVSFVVVTVLFALIFRFLPDTHVEWRDVWAGAFFTAFLFVVGKFALGLYLGKSAIGSSYGAAGSIVVLLVWIYWSTNILFFGAEFAQVYGRTDGSMSVAAPFRPPTGG
ncbi:MAG TPA: YihY/virulence factor BrkB family protein, partial [Thermoanaerobaculia bacterium]